jgi:hypothetical protein
MTTCWVPREGLLPVWVDFNRRGGDTVYLDLPATEADLRRLGIELVEGVVLNVWDADGNDFGERDDLVATGVVEWDSQRCAWFLRITRRSHESQE